MNMSVLVPWDDLSKSNDSTRSSSLISEFKRCDGVRVPPVLNVLTADTYVGLVAVDDDDGKLSRLS